MPAGRNGEPAQDDALLSLVDDSEAALEADARAELAKQLGAESVNGTRLDVGRMAA